MARITVIRGGEHRIIEASEGMTILGALTLSGITVDAPCGGRGKCRNCRCTVSGSVSPKAAIEDSDTERLACITTIHGDCCAEFADDNAAIATTGMGMYVSPDRNLPENALGVAVDIGTTTVAAYVHDLRSGARVFSDGALNPQKGMGADVISRITYCMENSDGISRLRDAMRACIVSLVRKSGVDASNIWLYSVTGNTTMELLFAGISPISLAAIPFEAPTLFGCSYTAREFKLPAHDGAAVYLHPAAAGFVGGDCISAILASGMTHDSSPSLLIDIGTNGEMAVHNNGTLLVCATAAGPAFEGADITCGMGGVTGAVSCVSYKDGAFSCETIGNALARGFCGSGLIDLLARLVECGGVDETGRLLPPDEAPAELSSMLIEDDNGVRIMLSDELYLTDKDVRKLQLAKAAIRGGLETLLTESGLSCADIGKLYIAGGFGCFLSLDSAASIGLIPPALRDKTIVTGNAAGEGAAMAVVSCAAEKELEAIRATCRYLELSSSAAFMDHYVDAMMFD